MRPDISAIHLQKKHINFTRLTVVFHSALILTFFSLHTKKEDFLHKKEKERIMELVVAVLSFSGGALSAERRIFYFIKSSLFTLIMNIRNL